MQKVFFFDIKCFRCLLGSHVIHMMWVVFMFIHIVSFDCYSIGKGLWIVNNKSPDIILIEIWSSFFHVSLFVTLGKNGENKLFDIPCNLSSDSRPLHEIIVKQSWSRQQTDFISSLIIRWKVGVLPNFQQFLHHYFFYWSLPDKSWRVSHSFSINKDMKRKRKEMKREVLEKLLKFNWKEAMFMVMSFSSLESSWKTSPNFLSLMENSYPSCILISIWIYDFYFGLKNVYIINFRVKRKKLFVCGLEVYCKIYAWKWSSEMKKMRREEEVQKMIRLNILSLF